MVAVVAEERCMVAEMTAERAVKLVEVSTEASLANNRNKKQMYIHSERK